MEIQTCWYKNELAVFCINVALESKHSERPTEKLMIESDFFPGFKYF